MNNVVDGSIFNVASAVGIDVCLAPCERHVPITPKFGETIRPFYSPSSSMRTHVHTPRPRLVYSGSLTVAATHPSSLHTRGVPRAPRGPALARCVLPSFQCGFRLAPPTTHTFLDVGAIGADWLNKHTKIYLSSVVPSLNLAHISWTAPCLCTHFKFVPSLHRRVSSRHSCEVLLSTSPLACLLTHGGPPPLQLPLLTKLSEHGASAIARKARLLSEVLYTKHP